MGDSELSITLVASGKQVAFSATASALNVITGGHTTEVPIYQVVQAEYKAERKIVQISYVARPKPKVPYALVRLMGEFDGEANVASEWLNKLSSNAYHGLQRGRRLKVLINPSGGTRKGALVFTKSVEPILRSAGCVLDVQYTTHNGHAYEIAKELPLEYDAILSVSGDGLIHEIMNGFAHHKHPMRAFAIPIAPIPAGSGNGLALNLLGLADGFDPVYAALNTVKGLPMKVDAFSFVQKGKRTISFMSQALGLMADLDIGTENLRWMGDTRFIVGLLRGLIAFKPSSVEFSYKAAAHDKAVMAAECIARHDNDKRNVSPFQDVADDTLPDLQFDYDSGEWTTFEKPLLYLYCGKGPYVGRDFMAFPASLPDDGLVDIVAQVASSRGEVLGEISEGAKGGHFWKDSCNYIKATAYRVKPIDSKGSMSVDGEVFPLDPFHVEVHQKLATVLSPHGYYAAEFPARPKDP